jgi:gliding motility-associated-like protein
LVTATIAGTASVCLNAVSPSITFTGANGAIPYTFTFTINGGANQTITTTTGNSVTVAVPTTSVGVFTYALVSVSSAGLASCSQAQSGSAVVTVNALPTATISGTTSICSGATALITFNGTPNAVVTYTINGGANQTITLAATGLATLTTPALTIDTTYALVSVALGANPCSQAQSGSAIVTISDVPDVLIDDLCQNQEFLLQATPVNNSFNPDNVTYTWSVNNSPIIGSNDSIFNIEEYLQQNPSVSLPLVFNVTVSENGCVGTDDFEVTYNPCKKIPRGISPNDDGDNDTFDLTGMGVKEITIFNRYGASVFYYNGTYTNQWNGQSAQGDELPDGTYFYSIHTIDGASKTGWVYINREY